ALTLQTCLLQIKRRTLPGLIDKQKCALRKLSGRSAEKDELGCVTTAVGEMREEELGGRFRRVLVDRRRRRNQKVATFIRASTKSNDTEAGCRRCCDAQHSLEPGQA